MTTFDSAKLSVPYRLQTITDEKIQLPDFQRRCVWDDEYVKSLMVSTARSCPVGAAMN